jgi:FdhE protein
MNDSQGPSGGGQLGEIPFLRLPQPEPLFSKRAERFASLAHGHTLSEYLELLARAASAQLAALETNSVCLLTPSRAPIDVGTHVRAPEWRDTLRVIVAELSATSMPAESRGALDLLARAPPDLVEPLADRVLANAAEGADLATGPFVAAALQVYFASLAAGVDPAAVSRRSGSCPVCGALPVVGVVLGDDRLRYLVCSVCATQWHHTRIQCTACGESKGLSYYQLEGERAASVPVAAAAKAEACPSCKSYTKLFYMERDPHLEPFADDVATLALDLLMAENGWSRHGVNLFLLPVDERATGRG